MFHVGTFKAPWHEGGGEAVCMGETFKTVGTQGLLELWYDLIRGKKISDAERV